MEVFDLEKALAGEPVKLRNGLKAYIKYVMPEQYKGDYPLRGFLLNLKGNVSETAWTTPIFTVQFAVQLRCNSMLH